MDRLQAMNVFVKVIQAGSFSKAAKLLNVGQPAISKTVAQLEQYLGVSLLTRSTHGLNPTDAGQRYYERVARVLEDTEEAESQARGIGRGLEGRLRVAAPTTFGRIQIIPRLGAFLENNPRLDIDIQLDDRRIDLVSEGIDICLRVGTLTDSSVIARKLATGRRSIIATPRYLEKAPALRAPEDFAHHTGIFYSQSSSARFALRRGEEAETIMLKSRLCLSAAEGIRSAVLADLGLTVAADWMFGPELDDGRAVRCLPEWELEPVDLWALFPGGKMTTAKARAFAEFTADIMKNYVMPRSSVLACR